MSQDQLNKQFWSIERVVAFVLAPAATAASGFVAAWLGKHAVHISGGAVYAYASTVSLGVAGSFIKWLDGRSKHTLAAINNVQGVIGDALSPFVNAIPAADREGLLLDIEGIVAGHIGKLAGKLPGAAPVAQAEPVEPTPAEEPAWIAPNDPAPETPPPAADVVPPAPVV